MANKPCRFCMRVRGLLTKYFRHPRKRALLSKPRSGVYKAKTQRGYIQGDSLLTVIIILALVVLLFYTLGK